MSEINSNVEQSYVNDLLKDYSVITEHGRKVLREFKKKDNVLTHESKPNPMMVDITKIVDTQHDEAFEMLDRYASLTRDFLDLIKKHRSLIDNYDVKYMLSFVLIGIPGIVGKVENLIQSSVKDINEIPPNIEYCFRLTQAENNLLWQLRYVLEKKGMNKRVKSLFKEVLSIIKWPSKSVPEVRIMLIDVFQDVFIKIIIALAHYLDSIENPQSHEQLDNDFVKLYLAMMELIIRNNIRLDDFFEMDFVEDGEFNLEKMIRSWKKPVRVSYFVEYMKACGMLEVTKKPLTTEYIDFIVNPAIDVLTDKECREYAKQITQVFLGHGHYDKGPFSSNSDAAMRMPENRAKKEEKSEPKNESSLQQVNQEVHDLNQKLDKIQTENKELESRLGSANNELTKQEKRIRELEKMLNEYEADKQELNTLREAFISDNKDNTENVPEPEKVDLDSKSILIVGGHPNWLSKYKNLHPKWQFIYCEKQIRSLDFVPNMDYIVFVSSHISHILYNRIIAICRNNNKTPLYINSTQSIEKCDAAIAAQILDRSKK